MRELLTIIRSAQHFPRLQDFLIHVTVIVPVHSSFPILPGKDDLPKGFEIR
jgi:hypothetical protein